MYAKLPSRRVLSQRQRVRNNMSSRMVALISLGLALTSSSAHAYLDPGTGSIVLQAVLAAVVGAAVTLKLYWMRVKVFFLSMFSSRKKVGTGAGPGSEP